MEDSSFPEVDPSKDPVTIIPHHGSSLHAVVPRTSPLPSKDLVTVIPSLAYKTPLHSAVHKASLLVCVKTIIFLSPLLDSHVGCAVYETPFAGTPRHQDAASRHSCRKWS